MFLFTRLKLTALAVAGVMGASLVAYLKGRQGAQEEAELEEFNEYVETRKRMDAVAPPSDADHAREWLRNRNQH